MTDDRFHTVTFQQWSNTMRNKFKTATTGLVLVAITGLAGCATNSDLKALQAEVQKTNATANQAASDAASAKQDAAAARSAAEEARDTAQDTNEKLDRMFKKSMYK